MSNYRFADLAIQMNCHYDLLQRRAEKYRSFESSPRDIFLKISPERITHPKERYKRLEPEEIELILLGAQFARKLLSYNGFVLHASAISFHQRGILFSADSGTGKSTHTRLWQTYFDRNQVPIINDDKPAIRFLDHTFYVYGNPFSGNSEENQNLKVPLHAVVFLERSAVNTIRSLSPAEALPLFMKQTLRPHTSMEHMDLLLTLLNELLLQIPVYLLRCNTDLSVVPLVVETLFPDA